MKKVYLSFMCLASITVATAQSNLTSVPQSVKKDKSSSTSSKPTQAQTIAKSAFWTNTFGTPSDWLMDNNETSGAGTDDNWTIGTAGGAGTYALDALTSTTASDGFALFDSDLFCSGAQSGYIYNAAPINCSAQTSVVLTFEQYFRKFNDNACFVGVSTDGVVWTDIQVNGTLAGNISTANGLLTSVNISAQAANQATVYIRFLYLSQGGTPSHGCDYNWMVDDVALSQADNYDLMLSKVLWGSSGTYGTLPYYQVPVSQIQPILSCGITENLGLMTQSDIEFHADITTPSYAGVSTFGTLASTEMDTFCVANTYTPATTLGVSTLDFSVASGSTDAMPLNNSVPSVDVEVTDYIYARDAGAQTSSYSNQGLAFEMGNVFDVFADEVLYNIDVTIDGTTAVGTLIHGILYEIDPATGDFTELDRTDDHEIVSADLDANISLELQNSPNVTAGGMYLVVIGSDGGTSPDLVLATAGTSEPQTTFFKDEAGEWFYSTSTPMVRMNFLNDIGLDEASNNFGVNVYPNPANATANVSFKLNNEAAVVVTIADLSGKTVYSNNMGTVTSGAHTTAINTDALSNGVYMVNVVANGVVSTQKLVVRK